jgi:hypothetical protein
MVSIPFIQTKGVNKQQEKAPLPWGKGALQKVE